MDLRRKRVSVRGGERRAVCRLNNVCLAVIIME
jgi:hypothetical protein